MRQIIKETLQSISLDKKSFTQQIKKMQKECNGRYGLNLNTEERKAMYDLISTMIEKDIRGESTENIETQYNIFRLAKHVMRSDKDIMDHY